MSGRHVPEAPNVCNGSNPAIAPAVNDWNWRKMDIHPDWLLAIQFDMRYQQRGCDCH